MLTLIKYYFINALQIGKLKSSDNRGKSVGILILAVFITLSIMVSVTSYAYLMGTSLNAIGAIELLPATFMVAVSAFILIYTIFATKGTLFGFRDYDFLISMPIKTSTVTASRIAILCIYELVFSFAVMLPALGVYVYFASPPPIFYIVAIVCTLLIPVIPVIIGSALGILVSLIASRFRRTNSIRIIALLLVSFGAVSLNFLVGTVNDETVDLIANAVRNLSRRYPPVGLFTSALKGALPEFLLFTAVSICLFLLFVLVVGRIFKQVNSAVSAVYTKGNYKLREVKTATAQSALFSKELRTYFGSALYVMNTGFGMVVILIASVAAVVIGKNTLVEMTGIPASMLELATPFMPLALTFMCALGPTTCCSISMEGTSFWHVQVFPVSAKMLFKAKIGVNLLISLPASLISAALLAICFKPAADILPFFFLTPAAFIFLVSILGLIINLHVPKLDWTNEAQVIKQSAAVVITVLIGFVIAGVPVMLFFLLQSAAVVYISTAAAAILAVLLWLYLGNAGEKILKRIA